VAVTVPYGLAITLVARSVTGQDAYGNDVYTEVTSAVTGAFNPGMSSELVQGQELVTMQPTVYLPAGTDLTPYDAVDVAGQRYEVDGTPNEWQSPLTGWQPGVVVKLKAVTG
jgi:hypothetical protein